ncbi:MAG: NAD(P)H-dependent flavin oxidoreductase [Gammaproteobacteria bacterium]
MIDSPLNSLLKINHPILLAPMAGVAGGQLTSAVSRAGGFGIMGGGYGDIDFLEREITLMDKTLPFGIGFITWRLEKDPSILEVALAAKPAAILLSFGDPGPYVEKVKASGALLFAQCQNLEDAKRAASLGADLIIAQGTEAGGHGGKRATMSLVPAVVDALPEHLVVGAGGIADGRGLAACLCLGAAGVMMGSRFYASKESLVADKAKQMAVLASGDGTIRSSIFDVLREYNWPQPYNLRTLKNDLSNRYEHDMAALHRNKAREIQRFNIARQEENYQQAPVIVGEAVDLICDIPPAGKVVRRIADEAEQAILSTHKLVRQ